MTYASFWGLLLLVPALLVLAAAAPLHSLLLLDIALPVFTGKWHIGGIYFDETATGLCSPV